jgi:hypothetical protein
VNRALWYLAALALAGCPKPPPAPVNPDAADASLPAEPDAARAPTCSRACIHVHAICPSSPLDVCENACARIKPHEAGFPGCLLAATTCTKANACDFGH